MSSPEQKDQTQMANPPTKQVKMVKIKTIHPIRLGEGKDERVITEGQVVEVTEAEAKEFCERKYDVGHKDFSGYRMGPQGPGKGHPGAVGTHVVRAVRVS